jgi:omega-6 fatty acid desaturase (delta-12 desaturase)
MVSFKLTKSDSKEENLVPDLPLPPENLVYNHVSQYAKAQWGQAIWELIQVLVLYYILDSICSWYLTFLYALVRVKMFIIFHDLAHQNFFPNQTANTVVGTLLGSTLLMSYTAWQRDHNYHHKHSNNLDRKQLSQTAPWTLEQYQKSPRWVQLSYSTVYSRFGILVLAPTFFFYFLHRFLGRWYENLLSLIYFGTLTYIGGLETITFDLGAGFFSGLFGVFLFHLQHTFPGVKRKRTAEWSYYENGMRYSSFLQLPRFLKYFTFGIEYHHIHHLNAKVPGYRLQECHEAAGDLFAGVPRVTLWDGFKSLSLSLYDEKQNKFL